MEEKKQNISLPDNAYRELKAGEEYKPLMSAESTPAEVTPYSVGMGVLMAIIFSAAAAFLGLKVGQVFEAAIPILYAGLISCGITLPSFTHFDMISSTSRLLYFAFLLTNTVALILAPLISHCFIFP